jgi:hypothetical protein
MAHVACDHCGVTGNPRELRRVMVTPRASSALDVGTLVLCPSCRTRPARSWRVRWTPVSAPEPV